MRQFDHNGLMLAEYQGKLFERSNELVVQQRYLLENFYFRFIIKIRFQ